MADVTLCDFGCSSVDGCTGKCQPPPVVRNGKYCRWCAEGARRIGTDHFVVESIIPAVIKVVTCKDYAASPTQLSRKGV